jgi:hypothetical protein
MLSWSLGFLCLIVSGCRSKTKIGYVITGGLAAVFCVVFLAFMVVALAIGAGAAAGWTSPHDVAGPFVGCLFAAIGSAFFVLFGLTAVISAVDEIENGQHPQVLLVDVHLPVGIVDHGAQLQVCKR